MMKLRFTLALLILAFTSSLFSQTVILNENFETEPENWVFEGNWYHEPGYIFMYYYPVVENYDFYSVSPEFPVPSTGGDLIIKHFIDVYLVNVTNEKCQILVIHDGQEDVVWDYSLTQGTWGSIFGTELLIPLDEYVGKNIQLKFRSFGARSNALWGWFIFNLNLTTFFHYDLQAIQLSGPKKLNPGQQGTWTVTVKNLGLNPVNTFAVHLYSFKSPQLLATASYNGSLAAGNTVTVPVNWATQEVHNTVLYAKVEHPMDQFSPNNRSGGSFLRIEPQQNYTILVWDNDNGIETIVNPETGQMQQASKAIENILQAAGISYQLSNTLPSNLQQYSMIISTMGSYCVGCGLIPPGYISPANQERLLDYLLNHHGNLYVESTKLGFDHSGTTLLNHFGIKFQEHGDTYEVQKLQSANDQMLQNVNFIYAGGNSVHYIVDRLITTGAEVLYTSEDGYQRVFAYSPGDAYRVVASSVLMGALKNGDSLSMKPYLMAEIVNYFLGLGTTTSLQEAFGMPVRSSVKVYPNPMSSHTTIEFSLEKESVVSISVFDILGKEVKTFPRAQYQAGVHSVAWDGASNQGSKLPDGIYFVKIVYGDESRTIRLNIQR